MPLFRFLEWSARQGGTLLAFAIAWATGLDGPLGAGLVIMATGCAATSSPAFARLVGRDRLLRIGRAVDGGSVWLVVLYGFGVMHGVLAQILADPAWVLGGILLGFAPAGRRIALAAGLLSGNRNMALYLAVLPATAEPRILLFFVLCQFPLFLSPLLLRPAYARLAPT